MKYIDTMSAHIIHTDSEGQTKGILEEFNPFWDQEYGMKSYVVPWGRFTARLIDMRGDICVFENKKGQKFHINAHLIESMVPLPDKTGKKVI